MKYRELYGDLRRHEMNLYISRHDNADKEREELNKKAFSVANRIAEVTALSEKLLNEYQNRRDEIAAADLQLQDLNERLRRYEVGIEHRSGESKLFTEKARSVKAKLASAQEDIAYSTKRIDDIDKEIRRSEAYAARNTERIESLRSSSETFRGDIEELSKKISEYEFMTGEHRKKVLDTFKDCRICVRTWARFRRRRTCSKKGFLKFSPKWKKSAPAAIRSRANTTCA